MTDQFLFQSLITDSKIPLRTVTDYDGNNWFVGEDIANSLQYKNSSHAIAKHVDDEDKRSLKTLPVDKLGASFDHLSLETILINETGIYSLILKSKRKEDKLL